MLVNDTKTMTAMPNAADDRKTSAASTQPKPAANGCRLEEVTWPFLCRSDGDSALRKVLVFFNCCGRRRKTKRRL